jgi:hypothetical protein
VIAATVLLPPFKDVIMPLAAAPSMAMVILVVLVIVVVRWVVKAGIGNQRWIASGISEGWAFRIALGLRSIRRLIRRLSTCRQGTETQ